MGFGFSWGSKGGNIPDDELPLIFPLKVSKDLFIEIDVMNIFSKILTDVADRTHGLKEEQLELLFDNCVQSEANHGLISLLSKAMAFREDLFLVYNPALPVLRRATPIEIIQIRNDYGKVGTSKAGVWISFAHYLKSDLVKLYSALEYITIASLHKSMNLSSALQLKMNDLRSSTGLNDSAEIRAQAVRIATALGAGKDVLTDAKDVIESSMPDLTAINASIEYLNSKRAFYLGMPCSYLEGEQTSGIGSTGEADTKATERGLKNYFISIMKPCLEAIFDGVKVTYKSQNYSQIDSAMNALKVFSITDDQYVSAENKTLIMNRLLDLDEDSEGDEPEEKPVLPSDQISYNNDYPVV